jgi:hypothetical protein
MNRKVRLVALFLVLVCMAAFAADINGKWKGALVTPGGMKSYVYDFKVEGNKLTGQAILNGKPASIDNGTINGDSFSFTEVGEFNGAKTIIKYTGKIVGDKIKLTRAFADFPPDTFTIKR